MCLRQPQNLSPPCGEVVGILPDDAAGRQQDRAFFLMISKDLLHARNMSKPLESLQFSYEGQAWSRI